MDNVKKRIIISMCAIVILILTLFGITYAYFMAKIVGNTNDKSISITAGYLELTYGDGNKTITVNNLIPGKTIESKTFTVENTGTGLVENYDVYLENVINELEYYEDLTYVLECTTDNGECSGSSGVFPKNDTVIVTNSIDKGVIHNYKLILTYKETHVNQSNDMNKKVSAKVNIKDDISNFKTFKIYGNSVQSKLPSEYQQVDYIESTGEEILSTDYVDKPETRIELDFIYTSIYNVNTEVAYLGANAGNLITISSDGYMSIAGNSDKDILAIPNTRYKVVLERDASGLRTGVINGTSKTGTKNTSVLNKFYLVGLGGSTNSSKIVGKIYSFKIYDKDVLVRDLIPCYRKSDAEVGMYDLVNDVFYTNTGSGELTKGNDVPNTETPIKIESLGEFDEETGKYKIPVKVNDELGNEITTNIYLAEPLRKIGQYTDYIDLGKKQVVRNIYSQFITEIAGTSSVSGTYKMFLTLMEKTPKFAGYIGLAISDKFISHSKGYTTLKNYGGYIQTYITSANLNRIAITFNDVSITTLEQANEKIGEGFDVYYVLAEPIIEENIELPNIILEEENSISVCSDNNVCASNIEVEFD